MKILDKFKKMIPESYKTASGNQAYNFDKNSITI